MLADEGHSVDGVFQHPRLFTSMDWQSSLEGPPCRDKVLAVKKKILGTFLIFVAGAAIGQVMSHPLPGGINGVVRLPDGAPLEGATVTAKTDCKEMGVNFVQEVKTLADGSFYVPPFATGDCNRIRLFAKKAEELWLETGHDVFYGGGNGTAPVVVIPSSTTTEITMGSQGDVGFLSGAGQSDRPIHMGRAVHQADACPGQKVRIGSGLFCNESTTGTVRSAS